MNGEPQPGQHQLGAGGGTTIPSPGRSPKQLLPGIGLHDLLHGRQACPDFTSFHQGISQISPREGLFSCHPLPKRGQICDIPARPQSLNDSVGLVIPASNITLPTVCLKGRSVTTSPPVVGPSLAMGDTGMLEEYFTSKRPSKQSAVLGY